MAKWTPADDIETFKQGWGLFQRSDNGKLELNSLDDPEGVAADFKIPLLQKFEGSNRDYQAASFVQTRADQGDPTCRKAIEELIEYKSPDLRRFKLKKTW